MWPGNLAAFVWQVPVPCSVSSCCTDPLCHHTSRAQSSELCTQPGQTSHSLEGQTSQITQEIYKWIKMRVNLSQVRHIQPGLQNTFLQLLLVAIWSLHNLFSAVQLYNEHTTSGFCLKHASSEFEWEDVLVEQLWKAEAAAANSDSSGILTQPVWPQWYADGICWWEFIDTTHYRGAYLRVPPPCTGMFHKQEISHPQPAWIPPLPENRGWCSWQSCTLQNSWRSVVRRRKLPDFVLYSLFPA